MYLFNPQSKVFKGINLGLITAMVMQFSLPGAYAIDHFVAIQKMKKAVINYKKDTDNKAELSVPNQNEQSSVNQLLKSSSTSKTTGGPGQAETGSASLGANGDLVDKFTGDFNYSIPLMDVEGYPLVINYNSNVSMNTESSWVGLGWDLNVGSVSREMRGLPDEFNGDQTIVKTLNEAKETETGEKIGLSFAYGYKSQKYDILPLAQITAIKGDYGNSYLGLGKTFALALSAKLNIGNDLYVSPNASIGFSNDTKRGIGFNHAFGLDAGYGTDKGTGGGLGFTFGKNFHSRLGTYEKNYGPSVDAGIRGNSAQLSSLSVVPYGSISMLPAVSTNTKGSNNSFQNEFSYSIMQGQNMFRFGLIIPSTYSYEKGIVTDNQSKIKLPALGYFHSGKRNSLYDYNVSVSVTTPIMDFNRSNDMEFSEEMKNLAFSTQAFDLFRASAMGLGATFRARRMDVGTYIDPSNIQDGDGKGNLTNIGLIQNNNTSTTQLQVGYARAKTENETSSGNFKAPNGSNLLEFTSQPKGASFDQAVYFKEIGEMTPSDMTDYTTAGGITPQKVGMQTVNDGKYIDLITSGFTSSINTNNDQQPVLATVYKPYTALEYSAIESDYKSYSSFTATPTSITRLVANTDKNLPNTENHLSAIEITSTDGIQYTFGIPAYELKSTDVSFAATGLYAPTAQAVKDQGCISYAPGVDNNTTNNRSSSHYYSKTEVPSYPHSFLLTKMVSSDYVDRSNDGLTIDDVGSYYKFNYTRVYSQANPFKWRFPMIQNGANFDQGLLGTELDDKAHYSYGEKEIWYAQSVESKNMVAEFILEDRLDAKSVVDENGQFDNAKALKCLKYIKLYNRDERIKNGANAVPLQVVEFVYNYKLCNNYPGNTNPDVTQRGKLTLVAIKSYTGKSSENGLYSYQFDYDYTATTNISYNPNAVDMWGTYKALNANKPYDVFPYADQDKVNADLYSSSWRINKITTPTKGTIGIVYEADRYATVQNKRAMNHIDVYKMTNLFEFIRMQTDGTFYTSLMYNDFYKDFTDESTLRSTAFPITWTQSLFDEFSDYYIKDKSHCKGGYRCDFGRIDVNRVPNNVVIFKVDPTLFANLNKPQADKLVKDMFFTDGSDQIKDLYFRLHVKVKGTTITELVPTFARVMENRPDIFNNKIPTPYNDDITTIGVMPAINGNYEYAYVVIEPAQVKEKELKNGDEGEQANEIRHTIQVNSLQKSALHFIRRNLQDVVYGSCADCVEDQDLDKAALFGMDLNLKMIEKGYAKSFLSDYTTLRLYSKNSIKFGGGSRVKTITVSDKWDDITMVGANNETLGEYTWNYYYDTRSISFGNAAFEPHSGIDENPLYYWDSYTNIAKRFPDETRFTTLPFAQLLYPTPMVGYSKMGIIGNFFDRAMSITEFHTTYDHPVLAYKTDIDKSIETNKPRNIVIGKTADQFGFTQGYSVVTNDYFGKIKETRIVKPDYLNQDVLGEVDVPIVSRSTYKYELSGNVAPVVDRSGVTTLRTIATEYDMHADSRFIKETSKLLTLGVNLKFTVAPTPIYIPTICPVVSASSRLQAFYSHTFVKHLNQSAVCTGVETEYLASVNQANNVAYDYYTGGAILTTLKDEFNDELSSLSFPSHWYYRELREKSFVEGTTVSCAVSSVGALTTANIEETLTPGDKVQLTNAPGTPTLIVAKKNTLGGAINLFLINEITGANYTTAGTFNIKILKTNRDNRLTEMMQSLTTKKDLFVNNAVVIPTTDILEASAISYKDRNSYRCVPTTQSPGKMEVKIGSTVNPYRLGIRGDLTMDGQYVLQTERNQDQHTYKTRFDGTYTNYKPYYELNANGKWYPITDNMHSSYATNNWRKSSEVTFYDPFGKGAESKDPLEVYSSALYQFNNELSMVPVAQAVNARQQEIAYDGFEDYGYYATGGFQSNSSHFDFKSNVNGTTVTVDATKRHSGKNSLKLSANTSTTVTKNVVTLSTCDPAYADTKNYVEVAECNCLKDFEPFKGSKYVISAWVRNDDPTTVSNAKIKVTTNGATPLNVTFSATGVVLDGWQRVEGTFTLPNDATQISVVLQNTSTTLTANYDDLRIHPFYAGMSTTVYDPATLLPMATHDANNFTTFYNYDENLNVVRVRVETVEGIKTVSETESGAYKQ